jgi:hypothetical protein
MLAMSVAMDLDLCMMGIDTAFMYAPSKTTVQGFPTIVDHADRSWRYLV